MSDMHDKYEKPRIEDIGSLQDLTEGKPKFGPVIPAYKPKGPKGYGSTESSITAFSFETTNN
jgi:hypothetical protein